MKIGTGTGQTARWLLAMVMAFGASVAMAQMSGTKHNLGSTLGGGPNKFSGTAEICVFCHTPHGADTSAAVPLWNRTLPAANTYTLYATLGTSTLDAEQMAVGSVSIACLSCHDGSQAMDTIINAPGSGLTGDAAWLAGTWAGANQLGGKLQVGAVTNLGKDLTNDHPIGIQYCGGGLSGAGTTVSGICSDADFKAPVTQNINGNQVFWVDTGGAGTRQKTDMVLYTRGFVAGSGPSVECASCHDPHSNNQTFLRISNAGSAVCLACHIK